MLSHHLLTFDSANLPESDQVGAHLIAGGTPLTATGSSLNVNLTNASVVVSATNLDIRDLTYVTDSVTAHINELVADDAVDANGSLKVGSRALSTLSAVSASGDRADMISDLYRRLRVTNAPDISGQATSHTAIDDTASQIDGTPLPGRQRVLIQNLSNQSVYLGHSNAVTVSTGIEIPKKGDYEFPCGENIELWMIASATITADVRLHEIA
jgi:hypothetical protein